VIQALPSMQAPAARRDARVVLPTRHPGRWGVASVIVVIAVLAAAQVVQNQRFHWDVVGQYFFSVPILQGVLKTLMLTASAMVIGITLGIVFAVLRLSPNPILSSAAWLYSWFFRGTPLLVQLLFWYFLSALYPTIGTDSFSWNTNSLISALSAALLGLGLNEGAYMSEIVRSGILSVPPGQSEAAQALGMTRAKVLRRVVLPQAMRVIIPPTGNETIGMLKNSALVLVIGYTELMTTASNIYARTYQTIPLLIVAALWYLLISALLSVAQFYIERHFGRGFSNSRVRRGAGTRVLSAGPEPATEGGGAR
jgi:polar amino acid transport system permease protein